MSISRQSVVSGPGSVTLNTLQIFDDGEISAGFDIETFDVQTSAHGKLGERLADVIGKVTFKPCGVVTQAILDALLPHKNPVIGGSLFGAADVPCIVHGVDGIKLTLLAAAVTRPPTLKISASEPLFSGDCEITSLLGNNLDPATDNTRYTIGSETWAGTIDPDDFITAPVSAAWGSFATIDTEDGWTIEPMFEVEAHKANGVGTYEMKLKSAGVMAKCVPLGFSMSQILAAQRIQGASAAIGSSRRSGQALTITSAGGLVITLNEADLKTAGFRWGDTVLRANEIGFVAARTINAGVPGAFWSAVLS